MAKHEKAARNNRDDKKQKYLNKKSKAGTSSNKTFTSNTRPVSYEETPFSPRIEEHAAVISKMPFTAQRDDYIQRLHQTYGTRYVQRLMESIGVQAKLTVSNPNDIYEQEADKVADTVTKSIESQAQRQSPEEEEELVQGKFDVQRQTPEEEEELQMAPDENPVATVADDVETRINSARGGGHPLPDEVKNPMEQVFGADFGEVRTHTDSEADTLNKQLSARAFTTGNDIFFKDGEYKPESTDGKKLLAHELTHTRQQGASKRIAPWWPLGHRTITDKVFNEDEALGGAYTKQAQEYLSKRSPDMDFIQDETNAMEKGIADSQPEIERMKKLIADGKIAEAKEIWNNNKLHKRPQWYMLHHGEGGFYKEDAATASPKNNAMTDELVKLAAALYNAGKREAGLSILSDALHQAEDRGSHQEGARFQGHDIRQTIKPEFVPEGAEKPDDYYKSSPDPDNASKNPGGAENALKYAQGVLSSFLAKIPGEPRQITMESPEGEQPGPRQRHTKIKLPKIALGGRLTALSTDLKTKLAGTTSEKTIENINEATWKAVVDSEGELGPEGARQIEDAVSKYAIVWVTSELTELVRKGEPFWVTHEKLMNIAEAEIEKLADLYPELLAGFSPENLLKIAKRAVMNFEYQREKRWAGGKPAPVLKDKPAPAPE